MWRSHPWCSQGSVLRRGSEGNLKLSHFNPAGAALCPSEGALVVSTPETRSPGVQWLLCRLGPSSQTQRSLVETWCQKKKNLHSKESG